MKDYLRTNMDYMFEVKTTKFDKVILDCQSFIHGINFYKDKKVVHSFYLEDDQCQDMHNYLRDSNDGKVPVCFEISENGKSLTLINEKNECF